MGATFSRLKNWTSLENLTDDELNAEFNNILTNFTPSGMDDYSASVAQMRIQTTPGAQGTESQATSLAGELERLRFVLNRLIGGTYWYDAPASTITLLNTSINQLQYTPPNRIISGRKRSTSNQSQFLVPDGTAATVNLRAASVNLSAFINDTLYTQTTDIAITGLSLAPSSNNTCLVNDANLASGKETRITGENDSILTYDTAGSEITNLVGKWAAFKIVNGSAETEYFLAYVKSTTQLTRCKRGYFFDSADAPSKRIKIANNETITLLRLTWVFLKNDGTLAVTYNNPTWSSVAPGSPAVGDFWYDLSVGQWKKYNGSSWASDSSLLIGICAQDTTGTKVARSLEFHAQFADTNNIDTEVLSNTEVQAADSGGIVSVNGTTISYGNGAPKWDIASHLATSTDMYDATEQASTFYYLYVKEDGGLVISDMEPYRRNSMRGKYHPYNTWRFIARVYNNAGSNFEYDIPDVATKRWRSFTPGFFGSGSDPTIGNGTLTGRLLKIAEDTFAFQFYILVGSTTNNGAGNYSIGYPTGLFLNTNRMAAGASIQNDSMGDCNVHDTGTNVYYTKLAYSSRTALTLFTSVVTGATITRGTQWSATNPMTPATGDEVIINTHPLPFENVV